MANKRLQAGVFLVVAALAGIAGFYFNRASLTFPVLEGATQRLMLTSFPDLGGKTQTLSQWRGNVLVVNFWATWCTPCREEIPALMRIHKKYAPKNLQLVGIGVDDAGKIRDYAVSMRIDYVVLVGGMGILGVSNDLGNQSGVLPFTVVLDRTGKVAYTHAGALTEAALDAVVAPLL
jgi:thiol-disulfide isomerase/thioredoxin